MKNENKKLMISSIMLLRTVDKHLICTALLPSLDSHSTALPIIISYCSRLLHFKHIVLWCRPDAVKHTFDRPGGTYLYLLPTYLVDLFVNIPITTQFRFPEHTAIFTTM